MSALLYVTDEEGSTDEIPVEEGQTLMEALRDNGYDIPAICGGAKSCGTCHVHVDTEWFNRLPEVSYDEEDLLQLSEHYDPERSRLACQVKFSPEIAGIHLAIVEN